MSERKVLNKYYSPDFDPAKIPRPRQPKNRQKRVRTMNSMDIRCKTCGNYIYKGTKFNARKEDAPQDYLGINLIWFYFKCTTCAAELVIKTDPKNSDYFVESGATRNFEHWRDEDEQIAKQKRKRESEEIGNAMKSLENRTLESKREIDILAALDEVKSMKSRQAKVSLDAMLYALQRSVEEKEKKLEEEDDALIKSVFGKSRAITRKINDDYLDDFDYGETSSNKFKKKKLSDYANTSESLRTEGMPRGTNNQGARKGISKSPMVAISIVKKQKPKDEKMQEEDANANFGNIGLISLLQSYDDDGDDF